MKLIYSPEPRGLGVPPAARFKQETIVERPQLGGHGTGGRRWRVTMRGALFTATLRARRNSWKTIVVENFNGMVLASRFHPQVWRSLLNSFQQLPHRPSLRLRFQHRKWPIVSSISHSTANQFSTSNEKNEETVRSDYWGIVPKKVVDEKGRAWRWKSFRPADSYKADVTIDLHKHHHIQTFGDRFAYWLVKALRWPTDIFFQRRYGCRAMMLETVAAVPGMVGGMLLHCKSLRRFEHSGGWIKVLLEEAENERMHLMTFMEVAAPVWYERALVFTVQGIFFNAYFLSYLISPWLSHRIVGYLEEEAIHSYTEFLKEIDKGTIKNGPAPPIAIDYWRLPENATIKDVVVVIRADEAHHRDVNHFAANIYKTGKDLKSEPAPLGYH